MVNCVPFSKFEKQENNTNKSFSYCKTTKIWWKNVNDDYLNAWKSLRKRVKIYPKLFNVHLFCFINILLLHDSFSLSSPNQTRIKHWEGPAWGQAHLRFRSYSRHQRRVHRRVLCVSKTESYFFSLSHNFLSWLNHSSFYLSAIRYITHSYVDIFVGVKGRKYRLLKMSIM